MSKKDLLSRDPKVEDIEDIIFHIEVKGYTPHFLVEVGDIYKELDPDIAVYYLEKTTRDVVAHLKKESEDILIREVR